VVKPFSTHALDQDSDDRGAKREIQNSDSLVAPMNIHA
jgi:hypothetical protein